MSLDKRCQSIFWNIIEGTLPDKNDTTIAGVKYFARVQNLTRCAKLYPQLTNVNEGFQKKCEEYNAGSHDKLMNAKSSLSDIDERAAMYALDDYSVYIRGECVKSLHGWNWVYYHTLYKGERTLAALGLGSVLWRTRKAPQYVKNTQEWIRNYKAKINK
ncbi:MAG: hypothetical protein EOP45_19395 [Sphingobacteriaceae bacterium]|nr:MAG: hypothetical protein EOP45_19395 [Sphingobacteriaceae bacterium]